MTYLCVPIFVTDLAKARRDIALAAESGAEMVELRIDRLKEPGIIGPLLQEKMLPAIVTCRPKWEGGDSELEDPDRSILLKLAAEEGSEWIDLEFLSAKKNESFLRPFLAEVPPEIKVRLILSSHYFRGRPERLYNIVSEMNQLPADVNKIVWTARTVRDNLEAFELLIQRTKPTIALCMGEAGLISRVLAKKFGGFLTFASLNREEATAPGQLTIAEMKDLYRWDAIQASTKVFGVVAHPVSHSMSPAIHNAAFNAIGYDGVYLPFLVEPSYESFKAFMESFVNFEKLDLSGLSVTIPHKGNALRYLKEKGAEIEELAIGIGAVNTIAIHRENGSVRLSGTNTDYAAILDSITTAAGIDRDQLSDLRIGVIGAGGTGRTAVAALAHYGTTVLVCNRTHERAKLLADEFDGKRGKVSATTLAELDGCDVWINTSSIGMHPNRDENPLGNHQPKWSSKTIVFDAVYNPMKTRFLAQAGVAGAKIINGAQMFVRQAAAQFQTWTGQAAPKEVMRKVVESRLGA